MTRDFSTISPSARSLLLVKARTDLPFARRAAELVFGTDVVAAAPTTPDAATRRRHFELRARSIDTVLDELAATRILELAAGLSFRGLARAAQPGVDYLDTDLPELAALKADLVAQLAPAPLAGRLRVQALDALDPAGFAAAVGALAPGPIAIVHEGLLMYLDDAEKARLAANIRAALRPRGGYWITADVYVRSERHLYREPHVEKFLAEHRVEERKFADWTAASAYFAAGGFEVAARHAPTTDPWRVRETWVMTTSP